MTRNIITALILGSISACTLLDSLPSDSPAPSIQPLPESPKPKPSPFIAPASIPLSAGFSVYLCLPYQYGVELKADDKHLLGTFGHDLISGCMKIYYPGLNQAGQRKLSALSYEATIEVIDFELSPKN